MDSTIVIWKSSSAAVQLDEQEGGDGGDDLEISDYRPIGKAKQY